MSIKRGGSKFGVKNPHGGLGSKRVRAALYYAKKRRLEEIGSGLTGTPYLFLDSEEGQLVGTLPAVQSWVDKGVGGHDFNIGTTSRRPLNNQFSQNGYFGVTFDGVDDFLENSSIILGDCTIYSVVASHTDPMLTNELGVIAASRKGGLSSDGFVHCSYTYSSSPTRRLFFEDSGTTIANYLNGEIASGSGLNIDKDQAYIHVATLSGADSTTGMQLGKKKDSPEYYGSNTLWQYLIFNGIHSPSQIAQNTTFLNKKYKVYGQGAVATVPPLLSWGGGAEVSWGDGTTISGV